MIRYEKTGQFELKRDVALIVLYVGILCRYFFYRYIVLFSKLNPDESKIEPKKGFGHHVEGKTVDVDKNSNVGSKKCFKADGISYEGDSKCVEGDRNGVNGDRKYFNGDGNPVMGRGKWNDGSIKTIDVKGKCVIVSKKTK